MSTRICQAYESTPIAALAHVAQCLAKAAVTLSEAAHAMSAAAELLAPGDSRPPFNKNEPTKAQDVAPIVSYESDRESSPTETDEESVCDEPSGQLNNGFWEDGVSYSEQDSDPAADHGGDSIKHSLSGQPTKDGHEFISTHPPSHLDLSVNRPRVGLSENENVTNPDRAYRMLVDHEADVLLFTCALISRFQKVVCYMYVGVPSLSIFQGLISNVTGIPVHVINKISPTELERVEAEFIHEKQSVLLLPESVSPHMVLGGQDSCVIHVGWPAKEQTYESQLKAHQARNNVVVACAGDQDLYTAGAAVVQRTEPWPGNTDSFQTSISNLRPLFDQKLTDLPYQQKGKVYPEWINSHGAYGPRHVASWTPSVLVHRANTYLLDVLRYGVLRFDSNDGDHTLQSSLPEVSWDFVKANGLEVAVEEGVLRVKQTSSGLNHISSLSRGDLIPTGTATLDEVPVPNSQQPTRPNSSLGSMLKSSSLAHSRPNTTSSAQSRMKGFLPTPGSTYFALEEDFDAVPLIGFLALTHSAAKVIIFFDDLGCLPHYHRLVHKITGQRVLITKSTGSKDQAQSDQNAAQAFLACSTPVILLLPYKLTKLPPALENSTVGCCIFWGAGDYVPFLQAHQNTLQLMTYATYLIMTNAQRESKGSMINAPEHPSSSDLLDFSVTSWLSPMRETTRSVLTNNLQIVKGLYGAHRNFFGSIPRNVLSAEGVARRLNRYSARVLLRGKAEDGSQRFPPVSEGFTTRASAIKALDLQPAVDAGLLTVG